MILAWAGGLAACFLWPIFTESPTQADDFTRYPVRVALLGYAIAVGCLLVDRARSVRTTLIARTAWVLGCAAFLVHVFAACHYYHHWSHAHAIAHVEAVSGFGQGVWFSYLFTAWWGVDAAWWLLSPGSYGRRPSWINLTTHLFMAFMVFNATVVYEHGWIRWAGIVTFVIFSVLLLRRVAGKTAFPHAMA